MPLVKMRKTACGPAGVLMPDTIHEMDVETASLYVESESAVYCNLDGTEKAVVKQVVETASLSANKGKK